MFKMTEHERLFVLIHSAEPSPWNARMFFSQEASRAYKRLSSYAEAEESITLFSTKLETLILTVLSPIEEALRLVRCQEDGNSELLEKLLGTLWASTIAFSQLPYLGRSTGYLDPARNEIHTSDRRLDLSLSCVASDTWEAIIAFSQGAAIGYDLLPQPGKEIMGQQILENVTSHLSAIDRLVAHAITVPPSGAFTVKVIDMLGWLAETLREDLREPRVALAKTPRP
jgi:hypothetical protein